MFISLVHCLAVAKQKQLNLMQKDFIPATTASQLEGKKKTKKHKTGLMCVGKEETHSKRLPMETEHSK